LRGPFGPSVKAKPKGAKIAGPCLGLRLRPHHSRRFSVLTDFPRFLGAPIGVLAHPRILRKEKRRVAVVVAGADVGADDLDVNDVVDDDDDGRRR
jgi:hypothetical protein